MVGEAALRNYLDKWDRKYWATYKVLDILQKVRGMACGGAWPVVWLGKGRAAAEHSRQGVMAAHSTMHQAVHHAVCVGSSMLCAFAHSAA
jgi:hypothetical protein